MIGIIIATHGMLGEGILHSAQMIVGEQENVKICSLKPGQAPEDFRIELEKAASGMEDILYLVDLWGGTPFHQVSALIEGKKNQAMITGINLALVIEALMTRTTCESPEALVAALLQTGKDAVRSVPEVNAVQKKTETVTEIADAGRIQYVLVRIDSRLLHGQVAAGWSKLVRPNRIIVVSDTVCNNLLRKRLIEQAAPPGVRAHVIPVSKMIEVDRDPRFGKTRALLLFEEPESVLRCVKAGVRITEVNLGSMAFSQGKISVNKVLSMNRKDVEIIEELLRRRITLDVRAVPGDVAEDIRSLIALAKKQLFNREVSQ